MHGKYEDFVYRSISRTANKTHVGMYLYVSTHAYMCVYTHMCRSLSLSVHLCVLNICIYIVYKYLLTKHTQHTHTHRHTLFLSLTPSLKKISLARSLAPSFVRETALDVRSFLLAVSPLVRSSKGLD